MKVFWSVEGVGDYLARLEPQRTIIPDEELEGIEGKQRQEIIDHYVDADFRERIFWTIESEE